jgi:hypothetical protein
VLRALRKRFPRTWFFTNDLDENYSRPSEIDYTQNLLVASHFGLELHPSLQRDVPPFRDSYQTATFLGVLMAVDEQRTHDVFQCFCPTILDPSHPDPAHPLWPVPQVQPNENDFTTAAIGLQKSPHWELLKPLVFEIGRQGAYQLTKTGYEPDNPTIPVKLDSPTADLNAAIHPPSVRELTRPSTAPWRYLVFGGIAFVVLLAINLTSVRRAVLYLLRPILSVFALALLFATRFTRKTGSGIDPRTPEEGKPPANKSDNSAGVWNAVIVMLILAICGLALWAVCHDHADPDGEPFSLFAGISVWPSVILRTLAGVLSIVFVAVGISSVRNIQRWICGATTEESPTTSSPQSMGAWLKDALRKWSFGRDDPDNSQKNACKDLAPWPSDLSQSCRLFLQCMMLSTWKAGKDATEVLKDYVFRGRPSVRVVRTAVPVVLYGIFGWALVYGTDSLPNNPVRGLIAPAADAIALPFASLGLFLIAFFVIDALRLGQRFVRLLGRQPAPWPTDLLSPRERNAWSNTRASLAASEPPSSMEVDGLSELQAIRTIAKVTDTLNKMIWFPFVVMLLLVVARQRMFGGWDYPLSLVILQLLLLAALFCHTWRLRIEADHARNTILDALRDNLRATVSTARARRDHFTDIIDEVERQQSGAFGHWTQDYFLQAMLLPLLGEGGIVFLQQFLGSR